MLLWSTPGMPAKSVSTPPFPAALRAVGLKATVARGRVLEVLHAALQPASHGEIEARLAAAASPLDRVTLYRVLDSLVTAGLALKAVDARGVFRFSAAQTGVAHQRHAHFRCEDCGGVFCLDAPPPAAPSLPDGFRLHGAELDLHGTCARCGDAGGGHPA